MEPGNSLISLIMENVILKETHYSASPSKHLLRRIPTGSFTPRATPGTSEVHLMLFSCNSVSRAPNPLLFLKNKHTQADLRDACNARNLESTEREESQSEVLTRRQDETPTKLQAMYGKRHCRIAVSKIFF